MKETSFASPPLPPTPIERILSPFQRFTQAESAGGILLLVATVAALAWANSPWGESYFHLWEIPISIGAPGFGLTETLHAWINDGLMAIFFFLVGLEIKRELLIGELASPRQAALPIAGALGGMIFPALIYVLINGGGRGAAGWGIPMATDIAFALGILALVGKGVPLALKVFLAALAIVDDLGAVLVIAFFYTDEIHWVALGIGGVFFLLLVLANSLHMRSPWPYALLGLGLWVCFLESGVHATIAGVLLAMTVPATTRINAGEYLRRGRGILNAFEEAGRRHGDNVRTNLEQQAAIAALESSSEAVQAPLQRIEHDLAGFVAFFIVPIFALANAGVSLRGAGIELLAEPITLGVILGLVVGKPLGITLFSWLAVRTRLAALPAEVSWSALHAISWLGGIGFTMSLFVAGLAFADPALLDEAKVGILSASAVAVFAGWFFLRRAQARPAAEPVQAPPRAATVA